VGANGLDLPLLVDGMNEKGLSGGLLFFPGYAGFQQVSAAEATSSIASFELLTYILTQFATVDEVKAGLPKIKVNQAPQEVFGMAVPVHATIHDANGKSIVIEYIGGQLQITDNPTSVMTNAPQISWHFTNIGQYANVTADPGASVTVGGKVFNPASSGTGMNGLPGDMSSPSRFLRAVFYKANAPVSPDAASAVDAAFHILNNFDIPPGAVRTSAESAAGGGISGYETTEWTAVADLKNKVYYLKTYGNQQVRSLPMSGLDLDAKAVSYFPLDQKPFVIDVTKP
jgi:choloylglycine hydrolase